MSAHIDRMKAEMADLDDKASKLAIFIDTNPLFDNLDPIDQALMRRQLNIWKNTHPSLMSAWRERLQFNIIATRCILV